MADQQTSAMHIMNATKSYCNECIAERNHSLLHSEIDTGSEGDGAYRWEVRNEMMKCLGCDTISLRRTITDNVDIDEFSRPVPSITFFPPAALRRKPEWVSELTRRHLFGPGENIIVDLINEIYICVQNDCRRAACMAIRALLEHVMIDKVGDNGSFAKNIAEFQTKGLISTTQKQFLETVIQAGHASMHRAYKPSKREIVALVNITESVIESSYMNEHRASELKKVIPAKK
jgi:hypothetical protein